MGAATIYKDALNEYYRKDVSRDDILDSMVLAAAARNELQTVPEIPDLTQPRIYYPTTETHFKMP